MNESLKALNLKSMQADEPTQSQIDSEFIRRLKLEEPKALDELWESLYRDGVIIARRYNKQDDLGKDAAVQSFTKITQRGIHSFKYQASFRRYCWMIISRELLNLLKKSGKAIEVELFEDVLQAPIDPNIEIADATTIWERIKNCVEGLKGNRKLVFEEVDLNGNSISQTAEFTGLSRNNISQLVSRARRDVRKCLENSGYQSFKDVLSL